MALSLKHAKNSAKADGGDATLVQPSDWNAEHTITAAVDKILGTNSASNTVTELTCTAAGRALIDDADASAQRTTLGLGALATKATIDSASLVNDDAITFAKLEQTPIFGQCQLSKSGSNLLLSPHRGNLLTINGVPQAAPDAGVTLSTGSLSPSTVYYIYAFMSGATMTMEASATAYATQAGTGVKIKNGDATRTLVGLARTDGSTAWVDSATQRFVRSWFNDPGIALLNGFTVDRSTTSTSYVEVNTEIRIEFLSWSGETVRIDGTGAAQNTNSSGFTDTSIGIDGTTPEDTFCRIQSTGSSAIVWTIAVGINKNGLSEGYHYATLLGKVNAGTGGWTGGSAGSRTTLRGYAKL